VVAKGIFVKIWYLIHDVMVEHLRSRMVYFYLVVLTILLTAVIVTKYSPFIDRGEALWFSGLEALPAAQHRERLTTLPGEDDPVLKRQFHLPEARPLDVPEDLSLVDHRWRDLVPIWVLELPQSDTGCFILAAQGGMLEEGPGTRGINRYVVQLINSYIANHPDEWPFLAQPAHCSAGGVWFSTSALAEYLPAAIESLFAMLSSPPVDPRERASAVLYDLGKAINERKSDPFLLARDQALAKLLPGYPLAEYPLGDWFDLVKMEKSTLHQHLQALLAPGRVGIIVAGPYKAEQVLEFITPLLSEFMTRPLNTFHQNYSSEGAQPGIYRETRGTGMKTSISAAVLLEAVPGTQRSPHYQQLFNVLFHDLTMQLRQKGLIYGGAFEGFFPVNDSVAFVVTFTCSRQKELLLLAELECLLTGFPDNISDRVLHGAVNSLKNVCRQNIVSSSAAAHHLLFEYFFRNNEAVSPLAEIETWSSLSLPATRALLEAEQTNRSFVFVSISPKREVR